MIMDPWTNLLHFEDAVSATACGEDAFGWAYETALDAYGYTNTIGFDSMAIADGVRGENAACDVDRALEHAFTHYDDLLRRLAN